MECPSCYDIYDLDQKIPRNLPCGHTYCQFCLEKMLEIHEYIECPNCREILDITEKPSSLSKNFIAIEMAMRQTDLFKKYNMCKEHREPQQFYCQTDRQDFCYKCIKKHSGHTFIELEFSKLKLEEYFLNTKVQADNFEKQIQKKQQGLEYQIKFLKFQQLQDIYKIESHIDKIIQNILSKKHQQIQQITDHYKDQIEQTEQELQRHTNWLDALNSSKYDLQKIQDSLSIHFIKIKLNLSIISLYMKIFNLFKTKLN